MAKIELKGSYTQHVRKIWESVKKHLAFWFSEDLVRLSWFVVCENVINGKIMKFCIEAILQLFFSTSKKKIELEKKFRNFLKIFKKNEKV